MARARCPLALAGSAHRLQPKHADRSSLPSGRWPTKRNSRSPLSFGHTPAVIEDASRKLIASGDIGVAPARAAASPLSRPRVRIAPAPSRASVTISMPHGWLLTPVFQCSRILRRSKLATPLQASRTHGARPGKAERLAHPPNDHRRGGPPSRRLCRQWHSYNLRIVMRRSAGQFLAGPRQCLALALDEGRKACHGIEVLG